MDRLNLRTKYCILNRTASSTLSRVGSFAPCCIRFSQRAPTIHWNRGAGRCVKRTDSTTGLVGAAPGALRRGSDAARSPPLRSSAYSLRLLRLLRREFADFDPRQIDADRSIRKLVIRTGLPSHALTWLEPPTRRSKMQLRA